MQPLHDRSLSIFIVTTIFLGISFISVCLRCFVRIKLVKAFGWDDTLMVFAMVNKAILTEGRAQLTNLPIVTQYLVRIMWYHRSVIRHWPKKRHAHTSRHHGNSDVCKSSVPASQKPYTWFKCATLSNCIPLVVVAGPNKLRLGLWSSKEFHRAGLAPSHCLSCTQNDPVGCHRRDRDCRLGVLVHVNTPVSPCLILLATSPTLYRSNI